MPERENRIAYTARRFLLVSLMLLGGFGCTADLSEGDGFSKTRLGLAKDANDHTLALVDESTTELSRCEQLERLTYSEEHSSNLRFKMLRLRPDTLIVFEAEAPLCVASFKEVAERLGREDPALADELWFSYVATLQSLSQSLDRTDLEDESDPGISPQAEISEDSAHEHPAGRAMDGPPWPEPCKPSLEDAPDVRNDS